MRRMAAVLVVGLCLATLGPWLSPGLSVTPGAALQDDGATVDERARKLQERLGNLCGNFDFYFRHEFAKGEMRPVRCSRTGGEKTVLVIYSFSSRRLKEAWLSEWGRLADERDEVVIRGPRWTVEVLVRRWAREARERLKG